MRLIAFALLVKLLLLAPSFCAASDPDEAEGPEPTATVLAQVLVTGEQPGPGLWRISRGEHSMYLLGTQSPLPRRMRWRSEQVEALVASSQAVVAPPTVAFTSDIGRIRGMMLLPSLLKARRNPEGQSLKDVVPEDIYQHWLAHKQRHLPNNRKVEQWRPLFAAQKLYEDAVESSGLRFRNLVWPVVEKAAKRSKVPVVTPSVAVRIEAPREAIKDFSRTSLDDLECFKLTLERLDTDLQSMRDRANAWAVGDLAVLRALPFVDQGPACIDAVLQSSVMSERGFADLPQRFRDAWLEAAEQALGEHRQSFAVLPMRLVLGDDSYVAELAARGYLVEPPAEVPLDGI